MGASSLCPSGGGDPGLGIVALAQIEANFTRRNSAILVKNNINLRALQDYTRQPGMITTKCLDRVLVPITKERFIHVAAQRAKTKRASIPFQVYGRCDYKNLHTEFREREMWDLVRYSGQCLSHCTLFVEEYQQHTCPRRDQIKRSGLEGESKETLDKEIFKSMLPTMKRKATSPQKYQATSA